MMSGRSTQPINTTVKWDGAPAIFAGIDPRDGKFFVAKKGIFNVQPLLYKTQSEIRTLIQLNSANFTTQLAMEKIEIIGVYGLFFIIFIYLLFL